MSRTKTKRILWTIAALVALSLFAVMVLHGHDKPRVIGNVSPQDVSIITESFQSGNRRTARALVIHHLQEISLVSLKRDILFFGRLKVVSIEAIQDDNALVSVGTGTNAMLSAVAHKTKSGAWSFARFDAIAPRRPSNTPTKGAPASQSGVVRTDNAEKPR